MFHYLLSFHYYRETDLDALAEAAGEPDLTFFADSGAFSAEHAGAVVKVEDYAAWLKRWKHRIHVYANLDVLHRPRQSRINYEQLRALDLEPLPVWHIGSPFEELERCLADPDYIAIGGMVRASLTKADPRLWRYLAHVHERAGETGTRLHGFGLGAWKLIERWPWFSADSSLASMGFRYGTVSAYDPYANRWAQWHLRDRRAWSTHAWLVREYELDPKDFQGSNVEARPALITLAARSWSVAAARLATRVYTTPHLSVASVKGPTSAPIGRELMRTYEDANREGARIYVAVYGSANPNGRAHHQLMKTYEDGNRWATQLYVSDPQAARRRQPLHLAVWQEGNGWARGAEGRTDAGDAARQGFADGRARGARRRSSSPAA